jgi:hypothetical protein
LRADQGVGRRQHEVLEERRLAAAGIPQDHGAAQAVATRQAQALVEGHVVVLLEIQLAELTKRPETVLVALHHAVHHPR